MAFTGLPIGRTVLAPDAQTDAAIQELAEGLKRIIQWGSDAPTADLQARIYFQLGVGVWIKTDDGWTAS